MPAAYDVALPIAEVESELNSHCFLTKNRRTGPSLAVQAHGHDGLEANIYFWTDSSLPQFEAHISRHFRHPTPKPIYRTQKTS